MKVPKWTIALAIVLVVAIAGYVIVRFSEASGESYATLQGGVGTVTKTDGSKYKQVDTNIVTASFNYSQVSAMNYYCVSYYAIRGTRARWYMQKSDGTTPMVDFAATQDGTGRICSLIGSKRSLAGPYKVYITELNPTAESSYFLVRSVYSSLTK